MDNITKGRFVSQTRLKPENLVVQVPLFEQGHLSRAAFNKKQKTIYKTLIQPRPGQVDQTSLTELWMLPYYESVEVDAFKQSTGSGQMLRLSTGTLCVRGDTWMDFMLPICSTGSFHAPS